jgi:hypothetical protein
MDSGVISLSNRSTSASTPTPPAGDALRVVASRLARRLSRPGIPEVAAAAASPSASAASTSFASCESTNEGTAPSCPAGGVTAPALRPRAASDSPAPVARSTDPSPVDDAVAGADGPTSLGARPPAPPTTPTPPARAGRPRASKTASASFGSSRSLSPPSEGATTTTEE